MSRVANTQKNHITITVDEVHNKINHLYFIINSDLIEKISDILLSYKWTILVNKSNIAFLTSDNPVVLKPNIHSPHRGYGFKTKGIEIYYPLSPKYALLISEPSYLEEVAPDLLDINVFEYPKDIAIHYNDIIIQGSTSQIYSNVNDFSWVYRRLKDSPQIQHKHRKRIQTN